MMAAFYFGCGASLIAIAMAPNLVVLGVALFALGVFAAIYHPVGMAMLIEASNARGRTLAFNGVCGNLGVSLAAGISAALAYWISWRAAFIAPALVSIVVGALYVWKTPDDAHHAGKRKSTAAIPLTPRLAVAVFGLLTVIALTAGVTFNILTIALPKIVDEGAAKDIPLAVVGGIATAVLLCGAVAQLAIGRLVERFAAHVLFAFITGIGFIGNLWAVYAHGVSLMIALAIAVAAIYAQVTVNDIVMARYTADAWRGRVYAIRYFLLFVSAGAAIGMIALLHSKGGFTLVLGVNAVIALAMFIATCGLTWLTSIITAARAAPQPAE